MGDLVTCKECGTRYDTTHGFCSRCGSTARGPVTPAVLAVAQRRDPGRRRVQAAGVLLLAVGGLFLTSTLVTLVMSDGDLPPEYIGFFDDQAGGMLVLTAANGTTYDALVSTMDGTPLANASGQSGDLGVDLTDHAAVRVQVASGGETHNATVVVFAGDTVRLLVDDLGDGDVIASDAVGTINRVATGIAVVFTIVLALGGLAALLLRAWPLAATAAVLGAFVGVFSLFLFLQTGLLFAIPFGFAAFFILRGRRYFARQGE